jgi:hypothetical protein
MKKLTFTIVIFLCVSMAFAQEKKEKMLLGLVSSHWDNPEYVYGKVKEIHYQSFHITDENGKIVKGNPFTMAESESVALRQPWSYYYNELGQLVQMKLKGRNDIIWTGVVHNQNNRIEKVYWLKVDTLWDCDEYNYLKNGNIETQSKRIRNNELLGKNILELDKNGFVIKTVGQDKYGKVVGTFQFTRNPDGTIKTYKFFAENGKDKHYYDNYKYNDHGLFESCQFKLLNGKEPEYPGENAEYEYDNHGNWTKRIGKGWILIERKIVYFE